MADRFTTLDLRHQYERARANGWLPHFVEAGRAWRLPAALLLAVASRETNVRNIKGDYRGGQYHGYSLMQLDIGSHRAWIDSGAWRAPRQAIHKGAQALAEKRAECIAALGRRVRSGSASVLVPPALAEADLLRCAVAAYNTGTARALSGFVRYGDPDRFTTGRDYSRMVLARAHTFESFLAQDKFTEDLATTPPEPAVDLIEPPAPLPPVPQPPPSPVTAVAVKASATAAPGAILAGAGPDIAWQILGVALVVLAVLGLAGYFVWATYQAWRLEVERLNRVAAPEEIAESGAER